MEALLAKWKSLIKCRKSVCHKSKGKFITRIRHSIRETQENKEGHKLSLTRLFSKHKRQY